MDGIYSCFDGDLYFTRDPIGAEYATLQERQSVGLDVRIDDYGALDHVVLAADDGAKFVLSLPPSRARELADALSRAASHQEAVDAKRLDVGTVYANAARVERK